MNYVLFASAVNFKFHMVPRRSGRYLKTFLEPVVSFSQSIIPFRAMATPLMPEMTSTLRLRSHMLCNYLCSYLSFSYLWQVPWGWRGGQLKGKDTNDTSHTPVDPKGVGGLCLHMLIFSVFIKLSTHVAIEMTWVFKLLLFDKRPSNTHGKMSSRNRTICSFDISIVIK